MTEPFFSKMLPIPFRMLNGTTALTNIEHGHNTTVTSESGRMRLTDNLLSINPQRLWVSWKTMPVLTRTFFSLRLSLSNHETINNKLSQHGETMVVRGALFFRLEAGRHFSLFRLLPMLV
ncbi:hypothetical protein Halar_0717 (plasmid) [halophilic archaeon DL31]|nr:hypothetical protein Halar_0717 [halophilic archaeon DL31]